MSYHRGTGMIVYDPYRGEMKRRTTGWCVVNVDKEITRYYRSWLQREKHIHLMPPSWDAHISIVRGEKLPSSVQHLWKKYDRQVIEFQYEHGEYHCADDPKNGGKYYWINVQSPLFTQIREELCLPVGWRFHITIGRTYEYEARKPKR